MSSSSEQVPDDVTNPLLVLLFSGKRKCGKDFITDLLLERIGSENARIIKISSPIKTHWAKMNDLNLEHLMSADEYKERYRLEMIKWSEAERAKDSGIFCREAVFIGNAIEKPIWIVSDVRRQTDIAWFLKQYGNIVRTIRVVADDDIRAKRGFIFTPGIDDKPSECDLDEVTDWHWKIVNNGSKEEIEESLGLLETEVKKSLKHQT